MDFRKIIHNKLTSWLGFVVFMAAMAAGFFSFFNFTNTGASLDSLNAGPSGIAAPSQEFEYKIISPKLPTELYFCGERVPLEDIEVRESLDRELIVNTYWHSATLLFIKRANRWFPVMEKILRDNDIPEDFKYAAVIESALSNAVSPAGAVGYWQILESVGRQYGLEVNKNVDERYSVEKSTEAACKYLRNSYRNFGNWTLSAASYNMGVSGVSRQLNKQRTKNYYDLFLNDETSRYVFRILAAKLIIENPEKYGFYVGPEDLYPEEEFSTAVVNRSIDDLAEFAVKNGITYKSLKHANPWLRDSYLRVSPGKSYTLKMSREEKTFALF